MAIKRATKSKPKSVKQLPVSNIVQHAFTMATNPKLLFDQAKAFVFLLFSMLLITGAAFLFGGMLFLFAYTTHSFLFMFLVLFVVVLLWFVALNIATVFFNGLRFHLAMQHATHKPLDFHLAWKLSASRWHDAFWTQVLLDGYIFSAAAIVLLLAVLLGTFNLVAGIYTMGVGILVLIALLIYIQPYLFALFPVVYFETLSPRNVFLRTHAYVKPHYWHVFALVIVFGLVSAIFGGFVSQASARMVEQSLALSPILALIAVLAFIFLQIIVNIFISTFGTAIQTQLYLRIGNPKQQNVFVSRDPLAKHLSRMAKNHPSHSPYHPVKWKTPAKKRK